MNTLVCFFPEGHHQHHLHGHPERPERVDALVDGLEEIGLWDSLVQTKPLELEGELLSRVHSKDYLSLLERVCQRGGMLDPDTYATRKSWQLALNAAGGAAAVVSEVWDRKAESGFALTRPPGHHATRNRGMGFCLINNAAVAAEYLLKEKGASKIAILDLDLHHGNGTQDIFWERPEVAFISLHQHPFYPGTGALEETGSGPGRGTTLNLPLPAYSGDSAFSTMMDEIILPFLSSQAPDFLLISFGFDTHWRDPLGSLLVTAGCLHRLMNDLRDWSQQETKGRLAVLLEGGYDLEAARACGGAVGAALAGIPFEDPLGNPPRSEGDSWREILPATRKTLSG